MTPQNTGASPARPAPKSLTANQTPAVYHKSPSRIYSPPKELLDRGPPKDVDAERAVLAIVLLVPGRISEVATILETADFADEVTRTLYAAMVRLHGRNIPLDITLLVGDLRDVGAYNADEGVSAATLVNLYRLYPLACNLTYYVARVKEMSRRRQALERGIQLIKAAHGDDPGPALPAPAIRRATQQALENRRRKAVRP